MTIGPMAHMFPTLALYADIHLFVAKGKNYKVPHPSSYSLTIISKDTKNLQFHFN